jgi:hypothetical protein
LPGNNKIITELGNNKNYFGSNSLQEIKKIIAGRI